MPRVPTPTVLKIAKGSDKKDPQRFRNVEPEFEATKFRDPPKEMGHVAAEKWRDLLPKLIGARVMSEGDFDVFRRLCELHAIYRDAHDDVARYGSTIEGRHGTVVRNPATTTLFEVCRELRQLENGFGLNPAARGKIDLGSKGAKKEEDFTSRRRRPA